MSTDPPPLHSATIGSPVWAIAGLFPEQGRWSEGDYLSLPGNRLIELCDGCLQFPPPPTERHQSIVGFVLSEVIRWRTERDGGWVMAGPFPIRTLGGNFRQPDVSFLRAGHSDLRREEYRDGVDWTLEVVSPVEPDRDLVDKRHEYAASGIPEYWIVDPRDRSVLVLRLEGDRYVDVERVTAGTIRSVTLDGFVVDLDAMFDAE